MPNPTHPRLQEDGSFSQMPEDQVGLNQIVIPEAAPVTPEVPPVEIEPVAQPDAAPAEPVYTLTRGNLYKDVERYLREDADFRHAVSTHYNKRTSRESRTKIRALEAELAEYKLKQEQREIEAMKPEEIDERFTKDPQFAKRYAELTHPGPRADVDEIAEWSYYDERREELFDEASADIPKDYIERMSAAFTSCHIHPGQRHGFYDHDDEGNFYLQRFNGNVKAARKAGFDRFQDVVRATQQQWKQYHATQKAPATPAPPSSPPPAPTAQAAPPPPPPSMPPPPTPQQATAQAVGQINPNLSQAPDLSAGGRSSPGTRRWHIDEIKAMKPDARIALFPNEGDWEAALNDGTVYAPGLSEKLGVA